jgi:hypothetical protein
MFGQGYEVLIMWGLFAKNVVKYLKQHWIVTAIWVLCGHKKQVGVLRVRETYAITVFSLFFPPQWFFCFPQFLPLTLSPGTKRYTYLCTSLWVALVNIMAVPLPYSEECNRLLYCMCMNVFWILAVWAQDKHVLRVPQNGYCTPILATCRLSLKGRGTKSVFVSECKIFCRPNL